jgi:hypothetical protein
VAVGAFWPEDFIEHRPQPIFRSDLAKMSDNAQPNDQADAIPTGRLKWNAI